MLSLDDRAVMELPSLLQQAKWQHCTVVWCIQCDQATRYSFTFSTIRKVATASLWARGSQQAPVARNVGSAVHSCGYQAALSS